MQSVQKRETVTRKVRFTIESLLLIKSQQLSSKQVAQARLHSHQAISGPTQPLLILLLALFTYSPLKPLEATILSMELHPSSQHSDTTVHTDNSLSDMEKATFLQRLGVSDSKRLATMT
jgi:hypothetical protein